MITVRATLNAQQMKLLSDLMQAVSLHMCLHPDDITDLDHTFHYDACIQNWTVDLRSPLLGRGKFSLDKNNKLQVLERCDVCQKYKPAAQIVNIEEFRSICRACTLKAYKQFKGETNVNSNKGKEDQGTEGTQEAKRAKKVKARKDDEAQQEDRMQSV